MGCVFEKEFDGGKDQRQSLGLVLGHGLYFSFRFVTLMDDVTLACNHNVIC